MIIVIVIISIVASIGLGFVFDLMSEQARREVRNDYEIKARVVIDHVAARLSASLLESTVVLKNTNPQSGDCKPLVSLLYDGSEGNILGWIGIDEEGRYGLWNGSYYAPGWSGLVDLNASSRDGVMTTIVSPGSNFESADQIIAALTEGSDFNKSALYYVGSSSWINACDDFDWNTTTAGAGKLRPIIRYTDPRTLEVKGTQSIRENYLISRSGYALMLQEGNLTLFYNFRPWLGEKPQDGKSSVLAEDVESFAFRYEGGVVRINVCVGGGRRAGELWSGLFADENLTVCKERAIVR